MSYNKRPRKKPRVRSGASSSYNPYYARSKARKPNDFYSSKRKKSVLTAGFVNTDVRQKRKRLTLTRIFGILLGVTIMFYSFVVILLLVVSQRYATAGYMGILFVLGAVITKGDIKERLKEITKKSSHNYDSFS